MVSLPKTGRAAPWRLPARWAAEMYAWALVMPTALLVLGTVLYPLVYSLIISTWRYNLDQPASRPFVGLANYLELLSSPEFLHSVWLTTWFTVVSVSLTLTVGLAVALLLNEPFPGRWLVRTAVLLPWVLPSVVVGMTWEWIFDANYGVLNALLLKLHLINGYKAWLGQPSLAPWAVMVAKVWKELPFVSLMFLAGLQTVPAHLYEAAHIDGATLWGRFRHITLPLLKPVLLVVLVVQTMWTFRVFDIIYVMTGGGPVNATNVITFYAYNETFHYLHLGKGAAAAYLVTLVILIASWGYFRLIRTDIEY